ncbi:MAG: DUF1674 domain-containing protein [Acidiferrobacterales bacterium]|nr:DUF1674 domain-containing protein [Acidiferrobacterales bacterium]
MPETSKPTSKSGYVDQDTERLPISDIAKQALQEAKDRKIEQNLAKEVNGPRGLEPTRYGDWEAKGRCYDF